jgi:hypothetical protein
MHQRLSYYYHISSSFVPFANSGDRLTHDEIITYLHGVYERWIKFENKSNEFQYPNKGDMEP